MQNIYLDIETIPSQEPWVKEYISENVSHPGTIKKEDSIKKWYEEKYHDAVEKAMEKTTFDGAMNHVICIGFAFDDEEPKTLTAKNVNEEAKILKAFHEIIKDRVLWGDTFIGHNVAQFDLRVIRQRSIVLGVPLNREIPYNAKPWESNPFDTMAQWDFKNNTKLDVLARAFGVGGKGDVDGSMVYPMWKKGQFKEIAEYCKDDVRLVRDVAKKMRGEL